MPTALELPDVVAQMAKLFLVVNSLAAAQPDKQMIETVGIAIRKLLHPILGFHVAVGANGVPYLAPCAGFDQVV
jgi:hypothetical protein